MTKIRSRGPAVVLPMLAVSRALFLLFALTGRVTDSIVVTARQPFRNIAELDEPVNGLIGIADAATAGVVTAKEIERRPFQRAGDILETVPGVIVSQHSGEGKANQYYLGGLDPQSGV